MSIKIQGVSKSFGNTKVLDNVSLDVKQGELVALLGPSGSGKTTLLRIIAGMERADSGQVLLDGVEASGKQARERNVGFVFQHYALFRHMTVFDNVAFGLRVRPRADRPSYENIQKRVMELLELVHLDAFHNRYPSQLSGGQRQRVALARALAVEPKLLLLDEPFGALDAKVRKELRRWMRRLHDEIHITSIFVTHDQEEAMEVSDRVVVMSNGHIEQVGTPAEVYHNPANSFVYDFLGNYNEFEGWRDENGSTHLLEYEATPEDLSLQAARQGGWANRYPELAHALRRFIPSLGAESRMLPRKKAAARATHDKPIKLFARPHELFLSREPDGQDSVSAKIIHLNPTGALVKIELERRNGAILSAELGKEVVDKLELKKNDQVFVRPKQTRIFDDVK